MNCQKCGNQINPGDVNCGICGTPVTQPVQNVNTEVPAAAPVATLEPVMEEVNNVVAPVAPAPVVPEAALVAPAAPVAPVMPAPVQEVAQPVVAPVEEVVPVAQPAPVVQPTPVAQPAPAAQPVPVAQPAPVAQPVAQPVAAAAPVAQPVAAAAPVVQPMPVAPKKNNTVFIIIIVLLVAAICAVGYMLVTDNNPFAGNDTKSSEKENSKDTDKKDDDKDNDKEDEDDDDKKTEDDDDNKIVNVDTFDYSGYKFKKLDSYQYASQNNVFLVKSSNTAITYYNLVHPYAYSNYTSQPETLKSYFAQSGYYTNIQYGEASYAGRNILVFTSNEAVIFFTKLSDYLTMQTEIVSIGTATNVDQVYAELNEIANSYDSTSMANAAEGEFKFEYTQPEHEEEKNLGTLEFIKK